MTQVIKELDFLDNPESTKFRPLIVAEMFYSIQGEGKTTGVPAYFIRLAGCNLECGGPGSLKDGQLHGVATWRCDSMEVWKRGKPRSYSEIIRTLSSFSAGDSDINEAREGFFQNLINGAHIVITGGEPLLQSVQIEYFLFMLFEDYVAFKQERNLFGLSEPFVEIETNGTITPSVPLFEVVSLWNVSPKLQNSGESAERRIVYDAITSFRVRAKDYQFKFVVSDKEDFFEALTDYILPYHLPVQNLCLMPACDNAEQLPVISQEVIQICMETAIRFSPRLHIHIWDQKTGV